MKSKNDHAAHPRKYVEELDKANESPAAISTEMLSTTSQSRHRVPEGLQIMLKTRMSGSKSSRSSRQEEASQRASVGETIKHKIKDLVNHISICQICESEIKRPKKKRQEVYVADCKHKNHFCQSCLHHYVIYKVNNFQQVLCPSQECPATLDENTVFFKSLPSDIRKSYHKQQQYLQTVKDPSTRLCPKQKCEGKIRLVQDAVLTCDICETEFCPQCFLTVHAGACNDEQVKFFEKNLRYRQCRKCKFIVQKINGCNHMTCMCGYQFCYVCGKKWSSKHYGSHDENGELIQSEGQSRTQCNCDCGWLDQTLGPTCAQVIKTPFKCVLYLLLLLMFLFMFLTRDFFVMIVMVVVSFVLGIFVYSCEVFDSMNGLKCCLAMIFLPITMMIGVGLAFREVYCDVVPAMLQENYQMLRDSSRAIYHM